MIFPYVASDPVKESIMTVHSRKELGEMTVLKEVPKQDFRTNFQGASSKRKIDNDVATASLGGRSHSSLEIASRKKCHQSGARTATCWSSGEDGDSSSSGEDGDMLELSSSDGEDEGLPVGLVEYYSRRQQSGAPAYFASVS
jgi:hypothetical protein